MKKTWYPTVYHPQKYGSKRCKTKKWLEIRGEVFTRDMYTCQMCNTIERDFFLMTAHHIRPRKKGGRDVLSNLITLCIDCHNVAELEQLTKKEIINYKEDKQIEIQEKQEGLRWQQWVYGGYAKPSN